MSKLLNLSLKKRERIVMVTCMVILYFTSIIVYKPTNRRVLRTILVLEHRKVSSAHRITFQEKGKTGFIVFIENWRCPEANFEANGTYEVWYRPGYGAFTNNLLVEVNNIG